MRKAELECIIYEEALKFEEKSRQFELDHMQKAEVETKLAIAEAERKTIESEKWKETEETLDCEFCVPDADDTVEGEPLQKKLRSGEICDCGQEEPDAKRHKNAIAFDNMNNMDKSTPTMNNTTSDNRVNDAMDAIHSENSGDALDEVVDPMIKAINITEGVFFPRLLPRLTRKR